MAYALIQKLLNEYDIHTFFSYIYNPVVYFEEVHNFAQNLLLRNIEIFVNEDSESPVAAPVRDCLVEKTKEKSGSSQDEEQVAKRPTIVFRA